MQKKIIWLILFLLGFTLILVISVYYFYFYPFEKQEVACPVESCHLSVALNQQMQQFIKPFISSKAFLYGADIQKQEEKEILEFIEQKNKLPQEEKEISLIAVGDVSFSRAVERAVKRANDINYPLLKIRDYFKTADLVFGNLETPITKGAEIPDFEMIFRSNPGTEQALKEAGFSILSLANNHTPNFGEKGLSDTFDYLDDAGIEYVGAGRNTKEANQPVFIEKEGIKLAFLAYNDNDVVPNSYEALEDRAGTAFMRIDKMIKAVKEAKKEANFVIVSMHSGIEYVNEPNNSQVNFARAAIDSGADLIIGHHPHVVQVMEKYKDKFIFYSLGNFIFDQPQSLETREGIAIKVYFTKNNVNKISILPVFMEKLAQPRMANDQESEKILKRLNFPLSEESVYFWDENKKDFQKSSKAVVYSGEFKKNTANQKIEQADLDNNLVKETFSLDKGRLTIQEKGETLWQSPAEWWIDDFILADSNNDGIKEINLSLWKAGNFGSSKPFWVEKNDMSIKNHFFVLRFKDRSVEQVWGSSNLSEPNCEFKIVDIDNDEENELVVIEGDYSEDFKCNGNYVAVWEWNDWGFSNQWRSEKGNFSGLEIEKIDGNNRIIVDTF
jgi:poly-gamma-glutamate synthesis protein (capsule biosynthesis protein)